MASLYFLRNEGFVSADSAVYVTQQLGCREVGRIWLPFLRKTISEAAPLDSLLQPPIQLIVAGAWVERWLLMLGLRNDGLCLERILSPRSRVNSDGNEQRLLRFLPSQ